MISLIVLAGISIHAPSRERLAAREKILKHRQISIHAPSRERPFFYLFARSWLSHFNPRSLAGATVFLLIRALVAIAFQSTLPRGSDVYLDSWTIFKRGISIHAPSRERQHQNKLLLYSFKSSIFCELAQLKYSKIYFDVRKLIVSHSSLSCEPKLNFMFHITSHRIILHYFYSCQSICK